MTQYNDAQKEAITHISGPMIVIAGPGSGKTMVITHRTRYLVGEAGVAPRNILVITFTKAAAHEMKERFQKLAGSGNLPVTFCTFHSLFFQILKQHYHYTAQDILLEPQKRMMLRDILERMELDIDDEGDFITSLAAEISMVKSEEISLEHYYSTSCSTEVFRKIYQAYLRKQENNHRIDFDDMMTYTKELFQMRPDILHMWQERFPFLLIDEFQDINKIQYEIIRMMAEPNRNLFIVGDDDQSIYGFRGARPGIMLEFEKQYPEAKRVILDYNYRSTPNIVEAAQRVIRNNRERFSKHGKAFREPGADVAVERFDTQAQQNVRILALIEEYRKKGYQWNEIAIICRTNMQPGMLVEKLMEYNIPFVMKDGIPNLYDHWIARNIIDYLKLAHGNRERALFLRIMNRPKRYISREWLTGSHVNLEELKQNTADKPWVSERIQKLQLDLGRIRNVPPYGAVSYIRHVVGYEDYLEEYAQFRNMKKEDLLDVLDQVQETTRPFTRQEDWFAHIEQYTAELEDQARQRARLQETDGITVTTMHSSKGLEYPIVFLVDACDGITPYKKAVKDSELEEERRMFYVAMTRAKDYLHICYPREIFQKTYAISRFVQEMQEAGDHPQKKDVSFEKEN